MLEIFGHRAMFNGIENSIESIPYYKKLGIELDLRFNNNEIYVSHDPTNEGDSFEEIYKMCKKTDLKMALHIKDNESINPVIKFLKKYSLKNYFLFDTENFEYDESIDSVKITQYVSKKEENIKRKILRSDESQEQWYAKGIIKDLQLKKKLVYVMSLKVVKKCTKKEVYLEWKRLINLGVNGICTKYPEKLLRFVKGDLN